MNRKEKQKFLRELKPLMREFSKLAKKYGESKTHYAMRRYLRQVMEEQTREKEIERLQRELSVLSKNKI